MSQVRKTTFITLVFMLSAGLLSGCGISGPLYAPGTGPDAKEVQQTPAPTQTTESIDNGVASKIPSSDEK